MGRLREHATAIDAQGFPLHSAQSADELVAVESVAQPGVTRCRQTEILE
jgi:hypothetical protein